MRRLLPSVPRRLPLAAVAACLAPLLVAPLLAQPPGHGHHAHADSLAAGAAAGFGALAFPTSAAPAAHAEFVRGVLYLHNFHYLQAVRAFQRARELDPGDVMSAAFEALAWTYPVWNLQDTAAARAALRRLAPTREARAAQARTPRERAWLDAAETLYAGDTPKPVRDSAFSRALARLHAADPRDPEAASFYALSLLGLNQGEREPRAYAAAEAVADTVLRAHPRHPGALHYKIHAVDDPQNAARGLAAAATYAQVASRAGHALHMTSHIFIALGRWDDVVRANLQAAATSPGVFGHGTHWLAYGLVQQGRPREARGWVDSMLTYQRRVADGLTAVRGRLDADAHAVLLPASYVTDTEAWDTPLARLRPDTAHLRHLPIHAAADFFVGYAAARRAARPVDLTPGSRAADRALADSLLARMAARRAAAAAAGQASPTEQGEAEVMEELLRAELEWGAGRRDAALARLRAAASRLEALPFAFGPPVVFKPPHERAGELLLLMGRPAEALLEFEHADRLAPGRTQVLRRRAQALHALGRHAEARRAYALLDSIWRDAEPDFPERTEARAGSGALAAAGAPAATDTVTYASGALRLRGTVVRPAEAAGRRPALVVLHGSAGCWSDWQAEALGRLFAERGYLSFFPCRRGLGLSTGQGEAVLDQLRREGLSERDSAYARRSTELLATTQLDDVLAALAAVRARPDVDPARVAVTGISYGGILTLLAAERDSSLRAAVAFAPAAMNWGWNAPLRARLTAAAGRTRVPTLVVQAENDWHTGPARELPAAMRAAGGTATGSLYPALGGNAGTGHGLMALAPNLWRDEVLAFLARHLPPAPR